MASPSTLIEIDDVFLTCPICRKSFKEPKLLPCHHRYCNDCLESSIKKDNPTVTCPLCKETCIVPKEGVGGFKTDVHMEQLVRFHRLYKAISDKSQLECTGCSEMRPFASYCFRCKGFLCNQCNEFHLTNKMLEDHKQKLLTLEGCEDKDFTLEWFSSLADPPKCDIHDEVFSKCCITCKNIPVCAFCSYVDHEGHDIHPVEMVANAERERISNKLQVLKYQQKLIYNLRERAEQAKVKLQENVASKKEMIQAVYERQASEIRLRLEENKAELERSQAEADEFQRSVLEEFNRKMNDEMHAVREKYEKIFERIIEENGNKKERLQKHHDRLEAMISSKAEILDNYFNDLSTDLETEEKQNLLDIEEIREHSTNTILRLENLDLSASSILSSENSWTDARCLPDISAAAETLIIDVVKDFPEVDGLADFDVGELPSVNVDNGTISERPECVEIDGLNSKGWEVNCMSTSRMEESVVVTGKATEDYSHITVVNLNGHPQRQDKRKKSRASVFMPFRYCAHLADTKFVTACQSLWDDIGVYEVRNGSYARKDIVGVPSSSRLNWQVSCIATDPIRKRLMVGNFNKKEIHVFDDKIKYIHSLSFPEVINWPRDMAVFNDKILVCDDDKKLAHVVAIPVTPQTECEAICEIPKPGTPDNDCTPLSVCTDSLGFIYILWDVKIRGQLTSVMAQYSKNGRQLLTKRHVDGNSRCLTTIRTGRGEKLLIATERSGKMYIFDLSSTPLKKVTEVDLQEGRHVAVDSKSLPSEQVHPTWKHWR